MDKVGKLLGGSRTEILEHNSGTAPGAKDSNDARYAELHLARDKADLDVGSPLKTDGRRCDEASGEAKVEDTAPKQKAPVRETHLGLALAAVAFMAATIRFRVLSRLSVVFHSWPEVAIKTYRQGSSRDDEKLHGTAAAIKKTASKRSFCTEIFRRLLVRRHRFGCGYDARDALLNGVLRDVTNNLIGDFATLEKE